MEVIRDYKQLNDLDKNLTYSVVGFTRSNVFNITHDYLYNHSKNKADRLLGILWDNTHDLSMFMNDPATESPYNEKQVLKWYEDRGFDYLFLPDASFMNTLLSLPKFNEILSIVDKIWIDEHYEKYLGSKDYVVSWYVPFLKLLMARSYFFYSDRNPDRLLNRTFQATAPDGTLGFITVHFWKKYCGGIFPLVPLIRNDDGLVFDYIVEKYKTIPNGKNIVNTFVSMVPSFNQFREDYNVDSLKENINNVLTHNGLKKFQNLFLVCIDHFNDELTFNKSVIRVAIRKNLLEVSNKNNIFRIWEYDSGF